MAIPPSLPAIDPNKLTPQQALLKIQGDKDPYWQNANREIYKRVRDLVSQHEKELYRGLQYATLFRGDPRERKIALTFDDGPHEKYTPRILAILKRYHVPATFFVVGSQAELFPWLIRAEVADGHLVANHTFHHVSLPKISEEYVADEIKACGMVILSSTGKTAHYFRPPGGEYNKQIAETAEALGYVTVLWTDDPGDYASPGEQVILSRVLRHISPGGIILVHDGIEQTIHILPRLIEILKRQGYQFVTVDKLKPAAPLQLTTKR